MNFSVENITEKNWKEIKETISIPIVNRPEKMVVNNDNGNFLIELGREHYSKEDVNSYRCILKFIEKSLIINITTEMSAQADVFWEAWSGIKEQHLLSVNEELSLIIPFFYEKIDKVEKINVNNNPFENIDENKCIDFLNSDLDFCISMRNTLKMNKYSRDLINGKKTFLKWKFYFLKYKGFKKTQYLTPKELDMFYQAIKNFPKRKTILLHHLKNGGNKFSDATKKFVEYLQQEENS